MRALLVLVLFLIVAGAQSQEQEEAPPLFLEAPQEAALAAAQWQPPEDNTPIRTAVQNAAGERPRALWHCGGKGQVAGGRKWPAAPGTRTRTMCSD